MTHKRSATAKLRRLQRRRQRQQQKAMTGSASGSVASFSYARLREVERAAFDRGRAAEREAAKARRGAKRMNKSIAKRQHKADKRMGRLRRATRN